MNLDEFLKMSLEQRRKARIRPRPRGPYKRRPERTPDELIEHLKTNNIRSVRQLRATRKPDDPNVHDVEKAFGSWQAAKESAFGKAEPFSLPKRPDPMYIVKTVTQFGLWSRDAYLAAHRRLPDSIYSTYWIRRLFGSWDKLRWAAEQTDIRACLERWMALRRRLGRSPTMAEVHQAGVSLEPLMRIHGTRAATTEFLNRLGQLADERETAAVQQSSDVSQPKLPPEGNAFVHSDGLPAGASA